MNRPNVAIAGLVVCLLSLVLSPTMLFADPQPAKSRDNKREKNSTGAAVVDTRIDSSSKRASAKAGARKRDTKAKASKSVAVQAKPKNVASNDVETTGRAIYERLLRSTARVIINHSNDWERFSWGTGWVLDDKENLLVTNHHVIEKEGRVAKDDEMRVYFPEYRDGKLITDPKHYLPRGTPYQATVFDSDSLRDLAILKLKKLPPGIEALELAAKSPSPGDRVHALGNPGASGAMWVYNVGNVRQVYRGKSTYTNGQVCEFLRVETQSPLNPGDSGGPVVNDRGQLVAVNQGFHTSARLVTYFVDVTELRDLLATVRPLMKAKSAEDLNERGVHYFERERYDRAVVDFTTAHRLDPKLADALGNRGWCFLEQDDAKTAIADFQAAIKLNNKDANYFEGRGLAYLANEDYELAIKDLTDAIRLVPQV